MYINKNYVVSGLFTMGLISAISYAVLSSGWGSISAGKKMVERWYQILLRNIYYISH